MGNGASKKTDASVSAPKQTVKFKLHVAIDFGTDGCGIAFAHNGKVDVYNKWKGKKKVRTEKTKTHILLNDKNEVTCFGNNAKFMYSNFHGKEKQTMKFFERFKMALYADDIKADKDDASDVKQPDDIGVDTKTYIFASNGKPLLASIVFEQAFKHLQELAKKYLFKITSDEIKDEEIQWILTVPAIWSESAKDKMRKWISEAGLVDESIIDQCIIVYEPDSASLALQREYFQHIHDDEGNQVHSNPTDDMDDEDEQDVKQRDRFEPGDIYVLVDAGGGTVDIACHEILSDGSVEEIIWPTGGDWGSCYIDDLFIQLLQDIFSKQWIEEYKKESPNEYVSISDNFQVAKKQFYENKKAKTHSVQLPFEFVQFLEEKCDTQNCEVEDKVHKYVKTADHYQQLFKDEKDEKDEKLNDDWNPNAYGNEKCVLKLLSTNENSKFKDGEEYLEMDCMIWKCMFDAKINKIISHVHGLLKRPLLKDDCKYLCLVGGFSSSKYLQAKMKHEFGSTSQYNLRFVIPSKPILSVVTGAAYFGITKDYIKARKLKYTYGLNVYWPKDYAKEMGISGDYIEKNTNDDGMVKNCFYIIAKKDEKVAFNDFKLSKVQRIPGQKKAFIQILCSDKDNPTVASDGVLLGSIEVDIADDDVHSEIMTEFQFHGTMFKVYSYPKSDPKKRTEAEIIYQK